MSVDILIFTLILIGDDYYIYDKLVERKLNFVNDDTQKDLISGQNMPQDPQDTQQSPDTGGDGAANAFSSDGGQSGSGDSGKGDGGPSKDAMSDLKSTLKGDGDDKDGDKKGDGADSSEPKIPGSGGDKDGKGGDKGDDALSKLKQFTGMNPLDKYNPIKAATDVFNKNKPPAQKAIGMIQNAIRMFRTFIALMQAMMAALQAAIMLAITTFLMKVLGMIVQFIMQVISWIAQTAMAVALAVGFMFFPILGVAIVGATVGTSYVVNTIAANNDHQRVVEEEEEACGQEEETSDKKKETVSATADASGGDWTVKGTQAYKNAEETWNYWKDKGFSGYGIAGIMGNIEAESGFNHLAFQNGADRTDPKNIGGATGTNGYGLYQISPGNKYGNWSGYDGTNSASNQAEYIWKGYGGASVNNGLEATLASRSDFVELLANSKSLDGEGGSVYGWYYVVENSTPYSVFAGPVAHGERRMIAAKKAYDLFGGDSVKYDASKFKSGGKSGDASKSSKTESTEEDPCDVTRGKKDTGDLGEASAEVTEALKKLQADVDAARTLGNGQCYGLTSYYVSYLTGGKYTLGAGASGGMAPVVGDTFSASNIGIGYDWTKIGFSVKLNPSLKDIKAGDIINWKAFSSYGPSEYGHTAVVAKVNNDGTFDIIQQNYLGKQYAIRTDKQSLVQSELSSIVRHNTNKK